MHRPGSSRWYWLRGTYQPPSIPISDHRITRRGPRGTRHVDIVEKDPRISRGVRIGPERLPSAYAADRDGKLSPQPVPSDPKAWWIPSEYWISRAVVWHGFTIDGDEGLANLPGWVVRIDIYNFVGLWSEGRIISSSQGWRSPFDFLAFGLRCVCRCLL